jgi:hypothetical protein
MDVGEVAWSDNEASKRLLYGCIKIYTIYKFKLLRKDLDTERSNVEVLKSNMIQLLITMVLLLMNLMNGYNGL